MPDAPLSSYITFTGFTSPTASGCIVTRSKERQYPYCTPRLAILILTMLLLAYCLVLLGDGNHRSSKDYQRQFANRGKLFFPTTSPLSTLLSQPTKLVILNLCTASIQDCFRVDTDIPLGSIKTCRLACPLIILDLLTISNRL